MTLDHTDGKAYILIPLHKGLERSLERPFVYAIVDLQTAAPLFLGTVETLESM